MPVAAIVPAAGSGARLGAAVPKAFVPVGGVPMALRAVRGLVSSGVVDEVWVAVPAELVGPAGELFTGLPVRVLAGAADRCGSVRRALGQWRACRSQRGGTHAGDDVVLVHDAARPLTPPALVAAVVAAVRAGGTSVVPVLPVADTVKRVDAAGAVLGTVERADLRAVQTPQGFPARVLERAHAASGGATDDAGLVEALGEPVRTVDGHPLAFKITTPWDLELAQRLLGHA